MSTTPVNSVASGSQTVTQSPEEASEIITFDQIFQQGQSIVVRLKNPTLKLVREKGSTFSLLANKFNKLFTKFTWKSDNVPEKENPELLSKNMKKMDKMFDSISDALNQQREHAKEEMKKMTPEQQEEFLKFLMEFTKFFKELFDMLRELTKLVAAFIKQGGKIDTKVLNGIFSEILKDIKELFSSI